MYNIRIIFILIAVAICILGITTFILLFTVPEKEPMLETSYTERDATTVPLSPKPFTIESTTSVPHSGGEDLKKPLGNDLNMEFPTLD